MRTLSLSGSQVAVNIRFEGSFTGKYRTAKYIVPTIGAQDRFCRVKSARPLGTADNQSIR